MLNTDKELKLYYSIGEVADMFGVNTSLLRFWEKEFPQISPKTAGRGRCGNNRAHLSSGERERHDASGRPPTFER